MIYLLFILALVLVLLALVFVVPILIYRIHRANKANANIDPAMAAANPSLYTARPSTKAVAYTLHGIGFVILLPTAIFFGYGDNLLSFTGLLMMMLSMAMPVAGSVIYSVLNKRTPSSLKNKIQAFGESWIMYVAGLIASIGLLILAALFDIDELLIVLVFGLVLISLAAAALSIFTRFVMGKPHQH